MEPLLAYAVGGEVEDMQPLLLLSDPRTDEPNSIVSQIVLPKVHDSEGVVRPKNTAQVLTVLCCEVVTSKI